MQAVSVVRPIMVALITANVVNAVANWVLIFGNLGAPALGVDGAGWATCISRGYMVIVLAVAVARQGVPPWTLTAGVRLAGVRRILGLGWPAAAQATLEYGAFAAVTMLAARLDPSTLAAHQIVINLAGLTYMVPLGIASAGAVRVGHAVGRRDAAGASAAGWTAIALGTGFMAYAAATFLAVPRAILGIFTTDGGVVEVGLTLITFVALFQIFDGQQGVATGALRGLGDTRTPMLLNLAGHWMVGLPVGYLLCFGIGWGVVGLWIGISIGLILVGGLVTAMWRRRTLALGSWPAVNGGGRFRRR
ncbi:MAG: MATE family efflux transporter [Acidobacteria bacterium]|nr:MATE family efflux transporter [Acidobacteriota bacterium]